MNFKLSIFFVLAVSAMMANAALNDGLVFDLDLSKGDTIANGRADESEISDSMTVSAAKPFAVGKIQYFENDESFVPVSVKNLDVVNPWFGFNSETNSLPCLYFPQPLKIEDNKTYGSGQYVNFSGIPVNSNCSIYVRFKWDGNVDNTAHNCFIAMNGYAWSNDRGWGVGLHTIANNPSRAKLMAMVGQKSHAAGIDSANGFDVEADRWYDAIYAFKSLENGGCEVKMWLCKDYGRCGLVTTSNEVSLPSGGITNSVSTYGFWLGGENSVIDKLSSWTEIGRNRMKNVFRGAIADVKVWNRVLDDREADLVFSGFTGEKWSIGAANGSNDEFAETAKSSVFKVDADKWSEFPKALDSSCMEVTISYPLRETEVRMPQVLTVIPVIPDELML